VKASGTIVPQVMDEGTSLVGAGVALLLIAAARTIEAGFQRGDAIIRGPQFVGKSGVDVRPKFLGCRADFLHAGREFGHRVGVLLVAGFNRELLTSFDLGKGFAGHGHYLFSDVVMAAMMRDRAEMSGTARTDVTVEPGTLGTATNEISTSRACVMWRMPPVR